MKKVIVMILVSVVLVIGFWGLFNYISNEGEFTKWSNSTLGIESLEDGNAYYFGYTFRWEGIGNPTIEKIEFIKSDGTIVAKDDEIRIQPFIASSESIGVLDEVTVIKEGLVNELVEVKDFKVDGDFHLVLRVELNVINPNNDISSLRITYNKYGVTQYQYIPFDEGFVTDQ
ncbi:hypothetical protein LC085_21665 [Bacillus tianshenii]|uniref:hypothetical protein n=1 Tax=Sutcliffiella tianshenii TaxID=1463404 RepID=UPI001CD59BDA|nr:hypothetical protein [Bacillus tianshenii]MCA1322487.1 hypothetical protein [Bacillus tianshenii]